MRNVMENSQDGTKNSIFYMLLLAHMDTAKIIGTKL